MDIIQDQFIKHIGGSTASWSGSTITVTDKSHMSINGLEFDSQGVMIQNGQVVHDVVSSGPIYCHNGTLYAISPIDGGYVYEMMAC